MSPASRLFAAISIVVAGAPLMSAQCSGYDSVPLWIWNPLFYQSSLSGTQITDLAASVSGWNNAQTALTISTNPYDDIDVSVDNSITDLGDTYIYPMAPYTGCANQYDGCGVCRNSNVIAYVDIKVSTTLIATEAAAYTSWTADQRLTSVLSHELGHALNLKDLGGSPTNCLQTSIMYLGNGAYTCNFIVAQSYCDGGDVNAAYSDAYFEDWDLDDPDFCGYCNQGAC